MPLVMLKKSWPGTFNRSVRDESGKILRTLTFAPGEPIDVSEEDLPAIEQDLGKALTYARLDEKARVREAGTPGDSEETGPDAGREFVPLDQLEDDELLKLAESEKVDITAAGDREAIIAALKAAGIDDVEVDTQLDLEALTVAQLRQLAKEKKVDVSKCRTKKDIIAALSAVATT